MKRIFLWTVLVLLGGSWKASAGAQDLSSKVTLSGIVVDQSGAVIPGSAVRVRSGGGASAMVYTGKDGAFSCAVQSGPVQLDVTEQGFQQLHWEALTATAEPLRLVLLVGRVSGPVVVAQSPEVPSEQPTASTQLLQSRPYSPVLNRSQGLAAVADANWEYGLQVSGGVGLEDRTNFSFLNAGVHAGRVLTSNFGSGLLRANFAYGVEVIPLWQSYTPKFQRLNCPAGATSAVQCYGPTTTGGTYRGASIVPIILRINFTHGERVMPWIQGAGGVLYTTRKYPAVGNLNVGDPTQTGPAADTSVWNFTPQGGVGMHYFVKPRRSLDFSVNAEHISSASLGDKNPGVNVSLQFAVGYSWWK